MEVSDELILSEYLNLNKSRIDCLSHSIMLALLQLKRITLMQTALTFSNKITFPVFIRSFLENCV